MFDILKDNQISSQLNNMNDNDFFAAIVAYSLKETYAKLSASFEQHNQDSEGIYTLNLFIPESLNQFVIDNIGYDIAHEHDAIIARDSYIPEIATHQMIEQIIGIRNDAPGYADVAISLFLGTNSHFDPEEVVSNSYKKNYIYTEKRLAAIERNEPSSEYGFKVYELKEQMERVDRSQNDFINMSADFAREFGTLRKCVESGGKPIQVPFIKHLSNPEAFTMIEFNGEGRSSYFLLFNETKVMIHKDEKYGDESNNYSFEMLDGRGTFEIDGVTYETSLAGIKTLEFNYFDSSSFIIKGDVDYLDTTEPKVEHAQKRKNTLKP